MVVDTHPYSMASTLERCKVMGPAPIAKQISRVGCWTVLLISLPALALLGGGCGRGRAKEPAPAVEQTPVVEQATSFSREELREALAAFVESALGAIRHAASALDKQFSTPQIRMTNLLWKIRSSQAYHAIMQLDDPADTLVEAWALCIRSRLYFESGEGRSLYGDHQHIAVDVARRNEAAIEDIGAKFFTAELLAETRSQVHEFARTHPITGTFSQLDIHLTEVSDWQQRDIPREILAGIAQISQSTSQLAQTAEKLPERLGEETWLLIEQIEAKRVSLHDANRPGAQATLEEVRAGSAALDRAAEKVGQAANSMKQAFAGICETATAWQDAADATRLLLDDYGAVPDSAQDAAESTPKIEDYRRTAEAAAMTAIELRGLMADLRELQQAGELAQYTLPARSLMNDLTLRLAGLIIAVFLLAAAYELVFRRATGKTGADQK